MGWVWVMIPLTVLMIPIVAILSHHQQKMAQILNRNSGDHGEITALRGEIAELKSLVQSQAIALDNLATTQRSLNAPPRYSELSEQAQ
jgi:hypothetical protein